MNLDHCPLGVNVPDPWLWNGNGPPSYIISMGFMKRSIGTLPPQQRFKFIRMKACTVKWGEEGHGGEEGQSAGKSLDAKFYKPDK